MAKITTWAIEPLAISDYLMVEDGLLRIRGRRIGIEDVIRYFDEGFSPEEISRALSGLDLEVVYALIAYYLHHRAALDDYIANLESEAAQSRAQWAQRRTPPSLKVESILRERGIYRS
ncbi:MAG: DUF433 domain-containing protein [Chloroflexi bacterium]|nr:DUF433 domain-containing protein [Chloroflexota bacterium]